MGSVSSDLILQWSGKMKEAAILKNEIGKLIGILNLKRFYISSLYIM